MKFPVGPSSANKRQNVISLENVVLEHSPFFPYPVRSPSPSHGLRKSYSAAFTIVLVSERMASAALASKTATIFRNGPIRNRNTPHLTSLATLVIPMAIFAKTSWREKGEILAGTNLRARLPYRRWREGAFHSSRSVPCDRVYFPETMMFQRWASGRTVFSLVADWELFWEKWRLGERPTRREWIPMAHSDAPQIVGWVVTFWGYFQLEVLFNLVDCFFFWRFYSKQ